MGELFRCQCREPWVSNDLLLAVCHTLLGGVVSTVSVRLCEILDRQCRRKNGQATNGMLSESLFVKVVR